MNRFTGERRTKTLRNMLLSIALFAAVMVLFLYGLGSVHAATQRQQIQSLTDALNRDIIHCYATEGAYPESLAYIEEHYGLTYDHDKYLIDYQPIAKNIMPTVTILAKEDGS